VLTLNTSMPFGWNTASITVTASGAASGGTTGTASANYLIVGKATVGVANTNGGYGATLTGASVANGASLAGVSTSLGTVGSFGIGQTSVTLLAGSNTSGGPVSPTMAWRSRGTAATPDVGPANVPLISDIVNVQNIGTGTNGYALQETYDPTALGADLAANIAAGSLYLGTRYNTGGGSTGVFNNAALFNSSGAAVTPGSEVLALASSATQNYAGSFSSFLTSLGGQYSADASNPSLLSQTQINSLVGSWGVDTGANAAWAVVNYDAEFGVVPEPGTFALFGAAVGAMALAYSRRRKAAQAV
jgi:hypothetical protein